jgi:hypothetical protein
MHNFKVVYRDEGEEVSMMKIQPHLNCLEQVAPSLGDPFLPVCQEDPELVRVIKKSYLVPPPPSAPYK